MQFAVRRLMLIFTFVFVFFQTNHSFVFAGIIYDPQDISEIDGEGKDIAQEILAKHQKEQKTSHYPGFFKLDLDEGVIAQLFKQPGIFSDQECDEVNSKQPKGKKACHQMGLVDRNTQLKPTGKMKIFESYDEDGNSEISGFIEVEAEVKKKTGETIKVKGYLPEDLVIYKEPESSYGKIIVDKIGQWGKWFKDKVAELCSPKPAAPAASVPIPAQKNLNDIAQVAKAAEQVVQQENQKRQSVNEVVDQIRGSVGQCVLNPPNKPPSPINGPIIYDQFALPKIKSTQLPAGIKKQNGDAISQKDLIDIDVLARTMYAEMGSCAPIGTQYLMAVSRVIQNREKVMTENPVKKAEFINSIESHDNSKTLMSKAASSPVQFSCWNRKIIDFDKLDEARRAEAQKNMPVLNPKDKNFQKKQRTAFSKAYAAASKKIKPSNKTGAYYKDNDSGQLHTLCPPSDPKKPFYTGGLPDPKETGIWDQILKVATETVLFKENFEKRTSALEGVAHYTSGRKKFYDFTQVKSATIDGRPLDNNRCLNLWKAVPKKK